MIIHHLLGLLITRSSIYDFTVDFKPEFQANNIETFNLKNYQKNNEMAIGAVYLLGIYNLCLILT